MGLCINKDSPVRSALLSGSVRLQLLKERKKDQNKNHLAENLVLFEFNRDINSFYEIADDVLGKGVNGAVKRCTNKKTRTVHALKTIYKPKVPKRKLPLIKAEITIMAKLDHPNILKVLECFETMEHLYIILELCTGKDLLANLQKQPNRIYSERRACEIVYMMLSAIRYCHQQGVVHRDIKPENFLFENDSPNARLKLIDFGFSKHFQSNETLTDDVGTPFYIAPEVIDKAYTEKCDIWSVGVATYLMLSGFFPFDGYSNAMILEAIRNDRPNYGRDEFDLVSKEGMSFIRKCLNRDIEERPSARQALQHPWFRMLELEPTAMTQEMSAEVIKSLQLFSNRSRLAKICLEVVAHVLNHDQIEGLRQKFDAFDTEKTGEIKFGDFKKVLSGYEEFSEADMRVLFAGLDSDKTGVIRYREFIAAAIDEQSITETNMRLAFDKLSLHSDFITVENLIDLLGMDAGEDEVYKMVADAGVANPDRITYEEFKSIMLTGDSDSQAATSVTTVTAFQHIHPDERRANFARGPTQSRGNVLSNRVPAPPESQTGSSTPSRTRKMSVLQSPYRKYSHQILNFDPSNPGSHVSSRIASRRPSANSPSASISSPIATRKQIDLKSPEASFLGNISLRKAADYSIHDIYTTHSGDSESDNPGTTNTVKTNISGQILSPKTSLLVSGQILSPKTSVHIGSLIPVPEVDLDASSSGVMVSRINELMNASQALHMQRLGSTHSEYTPGVERAASIRSTDVMITGSPSPLIRRSLMLTSYHQKAPSTLTHSYRRKAGAESPAGYRSREIDQLVSPLSVSASTVSLPSRDFNDDAKRSRSASRSLEKAPSSSSDIRSDSDVKDDGAAMVERGSITTILGNLSLSEDFREKRERRDSKNNEGGDSEEKVDMVRDRRGTKRVYCTDETAESMFLRELGEVLDTDEGTNTNLHNQSL